MCVINVGGVSMEKLRKSIKEQRFSSVYVVYGSDPYLYQETKKMFLNECMPKDDLEMNVSVYDMQHDTLSVVIAEANTLPFFGERKVIFVENALFLSSDKTKSNEAELSLLESYINEPNESSILILSLTNNTLDKRKKIVKSLLKKAAVIDVNPLSQEAMGKYVRHYIAQYQMECDDQALSELLWRTQFDLGTLVQMVDKLHLQILPKTYITLEDVKNGVPKSLESNIFALSEMLLQQKIAQAIQVYRDLVLQKEEPIKILAILLSQYRLMYQVSLLQQQGYTYQDAAGYLKQHPYRVQLAMQSVKHYRLEKLQNILNLLIEADYQLKTSVMNKDVLMELILIKIADKGNI